MRAATLLFLVLGSCIAFISNPSYDSATARLAALQRAAMDAGDRETLTSLFIPNMHVDVMDMYNNVAHNWDLSTYFDFILNCAASTTPGVLPEYKVLTVEEGAYEVVSGYPVGSGCQYLESNKVQLGWQSRSERGPTFLTTEPALVSKRTVVMNTTWHLTREELGRDHYYDAMNESGAWFQTPNQDVVPLIKAPRDALLRIVTEGAPLSLFFDLFCDNPRVKTINVDTNEAMWKTPLDYFTYDLFACTGDPANNSPNDFQWRVYQNGSYSYTWLFGSAYPVNSPCQFLENIQFLENTSGVHEMCEITTFLLPTNSV